MNNETNQITFAHLADIHLGSFREKKLKHLNSQQFIKTIDTIIQKKYDFTLIVGDIFNVPLPPLETVELVIHQMNRLKEKDIPIFVIGGSHDYSLTHKSFIDILDSAGVWVNVGKWQSKDNKTIELLPTTIEIKNLIINLYGVLGKKNGLDSKMYEKTKSTISNNKNECNIFMFHTTITELLPHKLVKIDQKNQFSYPSNMLPKGFNYYAGGHIHHPTIQNIHNDAYISYPGPIFPNSFSELKDQFSGFNECKISIHNDSTFTFQKPTYIPINLNPIHQLIVDCNELTTDQINEKLICQINAINQKELSNSIILFELFGEFQGDLKNIQVIEPIEKLYEHNVYIVLKNTTRLYSKQKKIHSKKTSFSSIQELHKKVVDSRKPSKPEIALKLLETNVEKHEDETIHHYETRVYDIISKTLQNNYKNI